MNAQLCHMLGYSIYYRYHVGFIITIFLIIDQTQLIIWINFILDIVTNCIEASYSMVSYFLWTNLAERKSGTSKVALDGSEDQVSLENVLQ